MKPQKTAAAWVCGEVVYFSESHKKINSTCCQYNVACASPFLPPPPIPVEVRAFIFTNETFARCSD